MGDYYAIHCDIKLKSDASKASKKIFENIDKAIVIGQDDPVSNLRNNIFGTSAYFEAWSTHTVRQREDGGLSFISFASSKVVETSGWLDFLTRIFGDLVLNDGDVLVQWVFEYNQQARCIAYSSETNSFYITNGVLYDSLDGPTDHPYMDDEGSDPVAPPMTLAGIAEYNAK